MNKITYGDIYNQFLKDTKINRCEIEDYRPTSSMFGVPYIPNAILVWLKSGNKIIYIYGGN